MILMEIVYIYNTTCMCIYIYNRHMAAFHQILPGEERDSYVLDYDSRIPRQWVRRIPYINIVASATQYNHQPTGAA